MKQNKTTCERLKILQSDNITIMSDKKDEESEIMTALFDEVIKMIQQKQIKIESLIQRAVEQGILTRESFDRINKTLSEYSQKKQWN